MGTEKKFESVVTNAAQVSQRIISLESEEPQLRKEGCGLIIICAE